MTEVMSCSSAKVWQSTPNLVYKVDVSGVEEHHPFYVPQQEVALLLRKIEQGVTAAGALGDGNTFPLTILCPTVKHVTEYVKEKLGILVVEECCSSGTELVRGLNTLSSHITAVTGSPPIAGVQ
jgi:hypothetical protein